MTIASRTPTMPPSSPGAAGRRCPRCAAPVDPGQRICVGCGAALQPRYRGGPSWRWPFALGAVLVVAAGAGAGFGIGALTASNHKTPPPRTVTTGTPTVAAPAPPAATTPAPPAPTPPKPAVPTRTTPTTGGLGAPTQSPSHVTAPSDSAKPAK